MAKAITNNFDIKTNFWKVNPGLMVVDPFKEFIKKEGTTESSKVMWFIALTCDTDSVYRNLPEELRIRTLLDNKLIDETWYKKHLPLIQSLKEMYYKLCETPAMRQLRIWNLKMDEKSHFMGDTTYDAQTYEMLEKMMASNLKIYGDYEAILKKLATEDGSVTRGGAQESLSDKGEI